MLLNLPTQLGNEIHGKLHADYSSRPKHNKEYRTMLRTRETWAKRERCVNNVVYSRMAHKNKWTFADGSLNRACDHRSHTRRFCARFVENRRRDQVGNAFPSGVSRWRQSVQHMEVLG
jgi:hypothetical protein